MKYRRFNGPESSDGFKFKIARSIRDFANARARALRTRAQRCRQLAGDSHDQGIVEALETYASELDEQAELLEFEIG